MSAVFAITAVIAPGAQQSMALAAETTASTTLTSASIPAPGVSATALSSWQTNNTVWALAYGNGVVYAGGQFTETRPPGVAAGKTTGEVSRTYLAEFNSTTGALITSFDPVITGSGVYSLAVSPDGSTLYVGGVFSHVNGQYRDNLAAFSTSTGALLSTWHPSANGKINAIAPSPSGSEIYIGGSFTTLGTTGTTAGVQKRTFAGAVDASGNLQPWAPVLSNDLTSIVVDPDDSQVLVGGYFADLNGVFQPAAGAVDPTTGKTNVPWGANIVPDTSHCFPPAVKTIVISGGVAYLGSEGTGGGCFDGDFAVSLGSSDSLVWQNDCLGATQALVVIDGYLFKGSHAHDCAYAPGGFPQVNNASGSGWVTWHLLDQSLTTGEVEHWTPDTNATLLGPRAMATDGSQLFLGGDQTTVNGKAQQGIAIFPAGEDATPPPAPSKPTVTSTFSGVAEVSFPAVSTPDVGTLTYNIYESGQTSPIGTITSTSWPWSKPIVHYYAEGLAPGSTVSFSVSASDQVKTSAMSATSASVKVASSNPSESYANTILAALPSFFWQLNETSGTVAADATSHGRNGTYEPGTSLGATGPISNSSNTVANFNGSDGIVTSDTAVTAPGLYSVEIWFKTTTATGGLIVGFGNSQTGTSTNYDRMIYMMNDGQLVFGMYSKGVQAIETPNAYNDGQWHMAVATFGSSEMSFYVDGALIGTKKIGATQSYTGYWRVGGGNLKEWNLDPWGSNSQGTTQPNSYFFNGSAGDVAVFGGVLSAAQVAAQYELAGP